MRGVAAAPEGLSGPEWVELIDPGADAELTKALTAWRAELAAADDGLDASPGPGRAPGRAARRTEAARPRRLRRARAPTSIRASTCRAARSGWAG